MKMNRKFLSLLLFSTLAVFGSGGCNRERGAEAAREDRASSFSPAEEEFMTKAAHVNRSEIEIARVALQKSDDIDVREYAKLVQGDHLNALTDLTDLMKDQNVLQPKSPPADAAQDIARANVLTGPEFDREFINMMVADHQKAVEMFRDQMTATQNRDVKRYVEVVLPKLEMHLEKAQRLQSKLFAVLK
jgi:putative membrane protein